MKRVLSVMFILLLVVSMIAPVHASDIQRITPRFTYVDSVWVCINIDPTWGIATCEGEVAAKDGYLVKTVVHLQAYKNRSWETIKTWTAEDHYSSYVCGSYAVMSGYTYRAFVIGYIYNSDGAVIEVVSSSHSVDYLV